MATVPDPPTNLVATPGIRQITVAFTPGADGGSPITNYQYSVNSRPFLLVDPPTITGPIIITGLDNNSPYDIVLQAINAIGVSQFSASVRATTFNYPSPPINLSAVPGNTQITVSFTPTPNGGSPVTNYQYSLNGDAYIPLAPPTVTSPIVIKGLQNQTTYQIILQAISDVGPSVDSALITASTLFFPRPPSALASTPGNRQLTISFAPGTDGGSPIINYQYSINGQGFIPFKPPVIASPVTITGLTNDTNYNITLQALTVMGSSVSSLTLSANTYSVAPPPANLAFIPGYQQVTITFTQPTAVLPVTNYVYSINGGPFIVPSPPILASPIIITGLQNNLSYKVTLKTVTSLGIGNLYSSIYASTYSNPFPPTNLSYTPGNAQITLAFIPGNDGGSPVTNYLYSINGGSFIAFSPAQASTPVLITGLSNNATYNIRLQAMSIVGVSLPSQSITAATLVNPSPPTNLAAIAGNAQVTITFAAGVNGGSPITNYLYSINGGASYTACSPAVTASPIIITGLLNNASYAVVLKAVTIIGTSVASSTITAATFTSPSPPTNLVSAPGNSQVTISFKPGSNGGVPITNYQYSINGGASFTAFNPAVTTSPVTITSLGVSVTYAVQLKAVSSIGISAASATVSAATYYTPSAPTIQSGTSGDKALTIYFSAGSPGSFPITNYQYSLNNGATFLTRNPPSTTSPLVISNLADGTTYQVQLKAINAIGTSAASSTLTIATYYVPSPPTGLSAASGNKQVSVYFTAGSPGSFPITNYQYSINNGTTYITRNPASTASPIVISNLLEGTTYQIRLKAINSVGTSAASSTVSATTYYPPNPPTGLSSAKGNKSVYIYFTPGSSGSLPLTNYQYSLNNGTFVNCNPVFITSPIIIYNLADGTSYRVELKAVSGAGVSASSAAVIATTFSLPSPPLELTYTPGDRQLTFSFIQGPTDGNPITNYLYSIDNGANFVARNPASAAIPLVISNLAVGGRYRVQLKAVNAIGVSVASTTIDATTSTIVYPIISVNANIEGDPLGQPWWWDGGSIDTFPNMYAAIAWIQANAPNAMAAYYFSNNPNVGTRINWYNYATSARGGTISFARGGGTVIQFKSGLPNAPTSSGTLPPLPATTSNYSLSNATRLVYGALWKTWDIPVDCNITNIKFNVSGQVNLNGNGWGLFYIWYVYNNITTPLLPDNGFYPPANGIPTGTNIQEVNIPLSRTPSTPGGLLFTSIRKGGKLNMYFSTLETYRTFYTRVLNNGLANELPFSITYQPT